MRPQSQHLLINVKIGSLSGCLAAKMLLQLSHNSASKRERCLRPSHSLGVQATFTSQHHRPNRVRYTHPHGLQTSFHKRHFSFKAFVIRFPGPQKPLKHVSYNIPSIPRANLPVRSTVGITNGGVPSTQVNIVLTLGSSLPVSARSYRTALFRLFGVGRLLLLCCTP